MLKEIGLKKIDELFSDIPEKIKYKELDLTKRYLLQQQTDRKNERYCFKK